MELLEAKRTKNNILFYYLPGDILKRRRYRCIAVNGPVLIARFQT